jgi:hypothetical protein
MVGLLAVDASEPYFFEEAASICPLSVGSAAEPPRHPP